MTKETIDRIPDEALINVITHSNDYSWNFFALKIILTRLNLKIIMNKNKKTTTILPECCNELRNLLKKSANVPNSQTDLKLIISLSK